MSNTSRNWMYERLDERGHISHFFINGVKTFIDFASSKKSYMDGDKIRCPCTKCHNKAYKAVDKAKFHLYKFGFVPNYDFWDKHGETSFDSTPLGRDDTHTTFNEPHEPTYTDMVLDAVGNEEKMQPYLSMYEELLKELMPDINEHDLATEVDKNFASWFENYARQNRIKNKYIHDLSRRPLRTVKSYNVYFVNGYKFHTQSYGANKTTMNSGLCISSPLGDYYGKLLEILEIEYPSLPIKSTVVFKCHWYDPTPNVGVKVHNQYKLVDINHRKKFNKFEPFILAMQATQVCFMPYPSLKQNNSDWLAVCKVKPRGWIEVRKSDHQKDVAFQEDEVEANEIINNMPENVEYEDISSNESDNENNNENQGEFVLDDVNNDDIDGDAESEGEFEYSTSSTDEEEDEEEDHCDDSD